MDCSEFDKCMIDYFVSKCLLRGSFTFLGEYDPGVVCGVEGTGLAISGSDLHIESINKILGTYELNDLPKDNNELPFEKMDEKGKQ